MKINKKFQHKKLIVAAVCVLVIMSMVFYRHETGAQITSQNTAIVLSADDLVTAQQEDFIVKAPVSGELYPINQTTIIAKVTAEAETVSVREGETVEKGQLLAKLNQADLVQVVKEKEAELSSAKASNQLAINTIKRYKKLLEQHFFSQNDYDVAMNQVQVTEANVKQAEAALKEAKLQVQYTNIISSLEGIVSERNIDPGMNVSVGQTLFKVINLKRLELRAVVPANQVSQVRTDQKVIFQVDGITQFFTGKVSRINPSTVSGTRAYYAYVDVDNVHETLKNGMFVTGDIILDERSQAIVIPYESVRHEVLHGVKNDYVYKINHEKKIEKQIVKLGLMDSASNKVQVLSGVKAGEVIMASDLNVLPGSSVVSP